jgi:hypothetical protein
LKKSYSNPFIISIIAIVLIALCILGMFILFGSGLAIWFIDSSASASQVASRPISINQARSLPTFTPTPTPTSISTFTPSPLPPSTATPTVVLAATPLPAIPPPTDTPSPTPLSPTSTPLPTDTPTPVPVTYPFIIKETAQFGTTHLNFDVFIAITDADNHPLAGYRVIGGHSSGLQLESAPSAAAWTENSGAMHYKAGNIKYAVPNSPSGVWNLQLIDSDGNPVGPPVEFSFDANNPTWYFLYYEGQ